jgi:hypothetical protein
MKFRFDAYCGLYCGACFIMNAYTQNRDDCLPQDWIDPLDGKEIKCYGCKSELVFENCCGCRIRSCAQSKDIDFCNNCSEFPCKNIKRLENTNLAHLKVAIHSLDIIKEIGVQEWLFKQKDRWLCSNCNYPFSWYEKNCIRCGTELFNSIDENKIL